MNGGTGGKYSTFKLVRTMETSIKMIGVKMIGDRRMIGVSKLEL
jgi:hypothetical protein